MDNRFLPSPTTAVPARTRRRPGPGAPDHRRRYLYGAACESGPMWVDDAGLVRAQSSSQRVLVVLIENGGIDLGIPELVDKLLGALPGAGMLPDDLRLKLINFLRIKIREATDELLESAELALNRYGDAKPALYGQVTVLRNGKATHDELRDTLLKHTREDRFVDLMVLTHGSENSIAVEGGVSDDAIRRWRATLGRPLALRSVYMMNCVGSSLNKAWLDAGAKVSSGSIGNNYLPEPTNTFFWRAWKNGQNFETAATSAYRKTVNLMNETVRAFVAALPIPGAGLLARQIDFESFDFVRVSAPMVQGQRSLTIASDALSFASSLSSGMATTVLPARLLAGLALSRSASLGAPGPDGTAIEVTHAFSYHSPSTAMRVRDDYSQMQNPAAAVIAGISVADAAQIGLAAAGVVQSQVNATSGSFQLSYDKAQRMLTADARHRMPGAQKAKTKYTRKLMWLGSNGPIVDFANALLIIEWEGNAYGEISTAVIRRDLKKSTDWSKSSAGIVISRLERIPVPGTDPRAWPLVFNYEGNFDPVGNGNFEFSGEFEINAFGGLKFVRHDVVSRSLLDFAIAGKPQDYVVKGQDVAFQTPEIPADQLKYLKENLP